MREACILITCWRIVFELKERALCSQFQCIFSLVISSLCQFNIIREPHLLQAVREWLEARKEKPWRCELFLTKPSSDGFFPKWRSWKCESHLNLYLLNGFWLAESWEHANTTCRGNEFGIEHGKEIKNNVCQMPVMNLECKQWLSVH